ncbi:MAG TPA: hypothetical protein VGL13_01290, partial [Polyangiaceae bacterium]
MTPRSCCGRDERGFGLRTAASPLAGLAAVFRAVAPCTCALRIVVRRACRAVVRTDVLALGDAPVSAFAVLLATPSDAARATPHTSENTLVRMRMSNLDAYPCHRPR